MSLNFGKSLSVSLILAITLAASPPLQARTEEPWKYLQDFALVEGAVRPMSTVYVGAVYRNRDEKLFALVIFPGQCESQGCTVTEPVGYFIVDTQGRLIKYHLEPGAKLESVLENFQVA